MTSDTTALVMAAIADVTGLAIAAGMWRRSRRRARATRSQHPSVRPPLAVTLVPAGRRSDVRIDALRGAPPLAVDIVSFRQAIADQPWDSVPLVDPLEIAPGEHTLVATSLPVDAGEVDVVVAWTARHATGDAEGSRLFRLPPERDLPVDPPSRAAALGGRPALVLAALLVAAGLLVVAAVVGDGDRGDAEPGPGIASPTTVPQETTVPTIPTTSAGSTASASTSPSSTMPSSTSPSSTAAAVDHATTTATTGATTTPSTTVPPTSPPTSPPTTTDASTPAVLVEGRIGPCRFADDCLIVGFRIAGFSFRPQEYVCEFEDASRFTFRFDSDGVDEACATGTADAAITVEIEGVRSETITRADVTPPP